MSNLPITTSAPQTAAKPAPTAAPAEEASTQGQPFGDVLARQVSEATTEATPPVKKATTKSAQEAVDDLKADATLPADETATNLPADMLAALLPAASVTTQANAPAPTETAGLSDSSQAPGIPEAGLPGQAAQAAATPETAGLPKPTAPSGIVQTGLDATQGTPAPTKNNINATRETLADTKKDAVFSSMMATMNANMTNKLSNADEKTAAITASQQQSSAAQASMQSATAPLTPAIVMPAVVTIDTPVSHDKWGDEFNQKITWLASSKEQSAELHLNPPQLGPMDVVLKVNGDQATALFSSPHAAVREAIEQALPKLREMMAESGIMLGNASVNDQAPRNRQNDPDSRPSGARSGIGGVAETSAASNLNMRVSPISRHNGIVDTFA